MLKHDQGSIKQLETMFDNTTDEIIMLEKFFVRFPKNEFPGTCGVNSSTLILACRPLLNLGLRPRTSSPSIAQSSQWRVVA